MIAFKGFHNNFQCTMGKGTFQYEVGKTYEEKECKCTANGFHCCENPLDVLDYYRGQHDRYAVVKAEGDINQDACGTKIACTKMTILKEITRLELGAYGCDYIRKHPEREITSPNLYMDKGKCNASSDFVIVRGKKPRAAAVAGGCFFLLIEEPDSPEIKDIYVYCANGTDAKPDTYYTIREGRLCEEKNC